MNIYKEYKKACNFLENVSRLETDLEYMKERESRDLKKYLLRTQDLLDRLGNPEKDLKIIHITGTSGKGTTVALIHRILQNVGYVVGSTLSPATTTTLERIKVNDLYIDPLRFIEIVEGLKPIILDMYLSGKYGRPSYFDLILTIALIYFKEQKCDYVILEVGMGGRFDATNVIKNTLASVITNVHYDHTHLLGNSLEEIAQEKAGIIKENSAFFTTEKRDVLLKKFKKICDDKHTHFYHVEEKEDPNLSLAFEIGKFLGVEEQYLQKENLSLSLPCRFELMQDSPRVILDGAHNVSKMAFSLKKLEKINYQKLFVVFSAGKTKDALGMLDLLANYTNHISLSINSSSHKKTFSLKDMYTFLSEKYPSLEISLFLDDEQALMENMEKAGEDDLILVTGSLYFTGSLRKKWYPEEYIIEKRKSF